MPKNTKNDLKEILLDLAKEIRLQVYQEAYEQLGKKIEHLQKEPKKKVVRDNVISLTDRLKNS